MFRGVGVAHTLHLVENMLKGLLYLVSLAFFIFGDGQQVIASQVGDVVGDVVRGASAPQSWL